MLFQQNKKYISTKWDDEILMMNIDNETCCIDNAMSGVRTVMPESLITSDSIISGNN